MVSKKHHPIDEKRQYQRLDHIFPVEFQFLDEKDRLGPAGIKGLPRMCPPAGFVSSSIR